MGGRGQAGNIMVDVRDQAGMTQEIAQRGINRAYGADNATAKRASRGPIQSIRVIGKDFDITVPRRP
jgi:filamentous hemagglutinin